LLLHSNAVYHWRIVAGTDRIENTAALLLPEQTAYKPTVPSIVVVSKQQP
jgi:hypothetical protein